MRVFNDGGVAVAIPCTSVAAVESVWEAEARPREPMRLCGCGR